MYEYYYICYSVVFVIYAASSKAGASNGSMRRSAECLALNLIAENEHATTNKSELPILCNSVTHQSLSASLPNLATPTEEFRGTVCDNIYVIALRDKSNIT